MKKSYPLRIWLTAGLIYAASGIFAAGALFADSHDDSDSSDTHNQEQETTTNKVVIDPEIAAVTEEEPDCE